MQAVVKNSFQGVFVDEYQDCTIDQHKMIMRFADLMPIHILGDELQGIKRGIMEMADGIIDPEYLRINNNFNLDENKISLVSFFRFVLNDETC